MNRFISTLIFFFALLVFPLQSIAAEIVGTVIEIEGAATATAKDSAPRPLSVNEPVELGELIETKQGSRLAVLLIDDTQFTLGENASLSVDEYVYDPQNNISSKARYRALRGAFIYVSGLLPKTEKSDVSIGTGYGSIGIRGTTVWGGLLDGEYGVLVQEGEVEVSTQTGTARLFANEGAFVSGYGSAPRKMPGWSDELKDRAFRTVKLRNAKAVQERIAAQREANIERRQMRAQALRQKRGEIIENRGERLEKLPYRKQHPVKRKLND